MVTSRRPSVDISASQSWKAVLTLLLTANSVRIRVQRLRFARQEGTSIWLSDLLFERSLLRATNHFAYPADFPGFSLRTFSDALYNSQGLDCGNTFRDQNPAILTNPCRKAQL